MIIRISIGTIRTIRSLTTKRTKQNIIKIYGFYNVVPPFY